LGACIVGLVLLLAPGMAHALEPTDPVVQTVPVGSAGNGGGLLVFNDISRNPSCSLTRNVINQADVTVSLRVLAADASELDVRQLAPGQQITIVIDHTVVTVPLFFRVDGDEPVEVAQVGPVEGCDAPAPTTSVEPPTSGPTTSTPSSTSTSPTTSAPGPTTSAPGPGPTTSAPGPTTSAPGPTTSAPITTPGVPSTPLLPPTAPLASVSPSLPTTSPTTWFAATVSGASTPSPLPVTGARVRGTAFAGLATVAGGLLLVGFGWRRRLTSGAKGRLRAG
jgi:hypothetical protein